MTAAAALRSGLVEAWRRPRLVGALFLLNVLWAGAMAWPAYAQLARATARRPYAEVLAGGLDLDVLLEVLQLHPAVVTAAGVGLAVGLLVWVVVSWFLTAGVLGTLRAPAAEVGLRAFAAAAVAHGFAMARIQLLGLVPYAVAAILAGGLGALAGWLGSRAASPWVAVWTGGAGAVPGLLLWLWVTTAVDVARVRVVLDDEPRAWRLLWAALRQVPRRPCRFVAVQLAGLALWLAVSLGYLALSRSSPFAFAGGVVLLTLLRESLVVVRSGIRLGVLSGTLQLAAERER